MIGTLRFRQVLGGALAGVLLAVPASAQNDERNPVVTAAVQVTDDPDPVRAHSSPQIVRNPDNGELVVGETEVYHDFGINVRISADDGRSWFRGGDPMTEPFTWTSDYAINGPYFTMAVDDEAGLYMAFTATDPRFADLNRAERPRSVFLARSTDGGRSFTTSFVYRVPEGDPTVVNNRRAMVAIDPNDASKVYVTWMQSTSAQKAKSLVAASADGGRTFGEPVDLAEPVEIGGYQGRPAVGPDGVVHVIFPGAGFTAQGPPGAPEPEDPIRPLFYRRSTDEGRTWSPVAEIDPGNAGFGHGRKHLLAADPGSGTLYAVWYGSPKTRPELLDDTDVYLRASSDGGTTWSNRVTVNDPVDAGGPERQGARQYDPGISIAPDGRVDIAWYDFRNSPVPESDADGPPFNHGGFQDVYYASSSDGGKTFGPDVRISDRIIDRRFGVWSNNVHSHYNVGVASSNESVYFAWQDTRNGSNLTNSEDVYFASLKWDAPVGSEAGQSSDGVPTWMAALTAMAMGMGIAALVALAVLRRVGSGSKTAPPTPATS
ncbi:MAG: glycoside hydrolase [Actinomycetota bacterium]|nr:glycoside hydrolase [Actinomycetota bacterium]